MKTKLSILATMLLLAACGGEKKAPSQAEKHDQPNAAHQAKSEEKHDKHDDEIEKRIQAAVNDKHDDDDDDDKHDKKEGKHDDHAHWTYTGEAGAAHWGDLSKDYHLCKMGQNQSPVNINQSEAHATGSPSVKREPANVPYELTNNGHTIQATPLEFGNSLKLNDKEFILRQFHFHTPSEHTFKEHHYPMEIHFVHQNATGQLAVLGVMVAAGAENPALVPFVQSKLEKDAKVKLAQALDIQSLFPQNTAHFRLNGSLTMPPCSEGVNWVVYTTPIHASQAQIDALRAVMGENNRPVQPINARLIVGESR